MVAVVAIAFVAAGCMRTSADLTIHDDRTADLVLEIVPDRQSWAEAGTLRELDGLVRILDEGAPDGIEVERVDTDRSSGIRLTWDRVPLEDLTQVVRFGDTDPVELQLFRSISVSSEDDVWQVDAVVPPLLESATLAFRGAVRELTGADATIRIALPGRVTSTNADEHDRSSATWEIDPRSSEPTALFVRSEPGLGIDPIWWLVMGLAVLVVLGALLIVTADRARVRRRLRRAARDAAGTTGDRWAPVPTHAAPASSGEPVGPGGATDGKIGGVGDPPKGMYQDVTGDDSIALPVGGRSWGPAPEAGATHGVVRSVVPSPNRPDPAASMSPASTSPPVTSVSAGGATEDPTSRQGIGAVAPSVELPDAGVPADASPRPVPVPPGWYPDPHAPEIQRFWDGQSWTDHRR